MAAEGVGSLTRRGSVGSPYDSDMERVTFDFEEAMLVS